MIIQCTECQTRFKLADDKMKPAGVRVRCTKCNEVFTALPPEPTAVPAVEEHPKPAQDFSENADFSDQDFANDTTESGEQSAQDADAGQEFDFGEFNMEGLDEEGDKPSEQEISSPAADDEAEPRTGESSFEFDIPDFPFDEESNEELESFSDEEEADELPPLEDLNLDDDEFTGFDDDDSESGTVTAGDFSLDDEPNIGGDLDLTFEDDSPEEELPELDSSPLGTQEFSFDDISDEPLVDPDDKEDAVGPIEFSFDGDEDPFALSEENDPSEATPETSDEFIFVDEPASEQEEPQVKASLQEPEPPPMPVAQKAEPPRNKRPARTSQSRTGKAKPKHRKKESGYRSVLTFLLVLLVAAAGYGYFGWLQGTYQPALLIERAQVLIKGIESNEQTGQIDISDLRSQFVANRSAGTLFVIQGNAVNHFDGARSAISVRGIIYDTTGKAILQQTAFCGNPLDEATLRKLPYAKIEEAMNNQFGEALSNLNIDPGQSIPFTIVLRKIPDQVAEFNVELADSRPGTK